MRCPKCGFISFDHLEECLKCNKNIKAASVGLFGSTYNIKPPSFLHLEREHREEHAEQMDISAEKSFDGEPEYLDEQLEILVEEEDDEFEGEINFTEDEQTGKQPSVEAKQENDGEIEIDFGQFEDVDDPEANLFDEDELEEDAQQDTVAQQPLTIEMPVELSDISDLAPPAKVIAEAEQPSGYPADSDSSDLNLDDLDFDLSLDGDQTNRKEVFEEATLTLDEIDFSDALAESNSDSSRQSGNMDMDEDLNFDLDLGGLSIHDEAK